ncbi:MAG: PmoA family protein [Acidobacteriia bacterium]|nr:PmoA family protein [Terriglobia bacterium]
MKWIVKWMVWFIACSLSAGSFEWRERSGSSLELTENGRSVFVYNHGAGRQCCYLHPVHSPGGVVVTGDGPADHKHHRGLFWAWPIVEVGGQRADLWTLKGAEHRFERILERNATASQASVRAEHSWMVQGKRVVKETMSITVYSAADQAGGQARKFEVTLIIEALDQPVSIAGAPESGKGYGGFSARFAPRKATAIESSDGPVQRDEDHVAHAWAELTGSFQAGRAGLRITSDAGNPGHPNEWCLRHYGFAGASFPGKPHYTLSPGKPVTLRYAVTVFDAAVLTQ